MERNIVKIINNDIINNVIIDNIIIAHMNVMGGRKNCNLAVVSFPFIWITNTVMYVMGI